MKNGKTHFAAVLLVLLGACGKRTPVNEKPIGTPVAIEAPLGLPPVPFPPNNPPTVETIALGRKLFYERKLSSGSALSCASCHSPTIGFSDGRKHSTGAGGKAGTRNSPSLINAAYGSLQFWDGRAPSLEEQAGGPMANALEMNQPHDVSISRLQADPVYRADFEKAFGPGPVTLTKLKEALASFERTLLSGDSPFDRYQYGGDKTALNASARRGLEIFRDPQKGNCTACHTIGDTYALFTDGKFHNIGAAVDEEGNLTDLGRYTETKIDSDKGAFKTPSLRNVAVSAPYMHDGSLKSLTDVVQFYVGGGNSNPHLDKEIKPLKLTPQDQGDLLEFLTSLTGGMPPDAGPPTDKKTAALR